MKYPKGFFRNPELVDALESLRESLVDSAMVCGAIDGRNWRAWAKGGASRPALLEFATNAWEDGFEDWADDLQESADIYAKCFHCWKLATKLYK